MFSEFKNFRYQSFKQLKNDCVRADNLFNDGIFGADHLCLDINGSMQDRVLQWLRPKEIYPDPKLGVGGAEKGIFSSPAIAAALTAIGCTTALKDQVIAKDQEWNSEKPQLYRGIFHFHFHYFGEWTDVVVDDRLPTQKHKLVYMGGEFANEFWPALVEKAYAKLHGGYNVVNLIPVTDILADFTGGVSEVMDLTSFSSEHLSAAEEWIQFYEMLEESQLSNTVFIATKSTKEGGEEYSENGIQENGLYVVADIKKVNVGGIFSRDYIYLLKMVSPTTEVWTGAYSNESVELAQLSDSAKKEMKTTSPRQFWMTVGDFMSEFTHLIVNHVINTSLLSLAKTWRVEQFRSWWGDGKAGGFNSDRAIFIRCNHQYFMDITDDEVVVLIELTQKPQYTGAVSSCNPFDEGTAPAFKQIGFAILEVELNRRFRVHRTHYETVKESEFQASRSVSLRVNLPAGRYCVIPCTYDMNVSGEFVLRFFTSKAVDIRQVVEEAPTRHWLIKCFQKPHLACMTLTVGGIQMIEGVTEHPEALGALMEQEMYVQVCCESVNEKTSLKRGATWNESCVCYLTSPVTALLTVKVFKKNVIGSGLIGSSSLPLPGIFGTVQRIDETRDKEVLMRLRDKNNINLEIQLRVVASFYTDLMDA